MDAPCSGLGTVHRRPEILLRVTPADVEALARTQATILARVAPLVRPGGTLVYAVCSPLEEEGAAIADAFEAAHPGFTRAPIDEAPLRSDADGVLRLGPWLDGCDAYQAVRWTRG